MMDTVERFVAESNISHFLEMLEREPDSAQRTIWNQMMLAEAARFGEIVERLEIIERSLEICSERIARQKAVVDGLGDGSPRLEMAKTLLANLRESLMFMQVCRDDARKSVTP